MTIFQDTVTFTGDVNILGTFNVPSTISGTFAYDKIAQRSLQSDGIKLTELRVHDAFGTVLPTTSSADDLGLYGGSFASSSFWVGTGDVKATSVTRYARTEPYILPWNYVSGTTVKLRAYAGMKTTASDTSATLDVEVYKSDGEQGIGSDLCTTAATSINSTSFTNYDFTITGTGLVAGDILEARITIAVVDSATPTAVDPTIGKLYWLSNRQ